MANKTDGTDIAIAGVKTTAAAAWALLLTWLISTRADLEPVTYAAMQTGFTGGLTIIGNAMQEAKSKVLNIIGRVLLLMEKTPVYTSPRTEI